MFATKKVSKLLESDFEKPKFNKTRAQKLSERSEEIKNPSMSQPKSEKPELKIEPPKPSSKHSQASPEPQAQGNEDARAANTYSKNMKKFYGVSSQCSNKGAPEVPSSKRSELNSKASYTKDAGAFYGDGVAAIKGY